MSDEITHAVASMLERSKKPVFSPEDINYIANTINRYFGEFKRSQQFRGTELKLLPRFSEMLQFFDREQGVNFANLFFLFCYTLTQNYKQVQTSIHDCVALPYKQWAKAKWHNLTPAVEKITNGNEFIFVCRHAVTKGGYAPGSSTFTFVKALLNQNRSVTVINFGQQSGEFSRLQETHSNFRIVSLEQTSPLPKLISLIELLKLLKPKAILTEIEFDVISLISIIGARIPVIYLSPGYYNLPWYDKIGLTDNLSDNPVGNRTDDFFEIPTYVAGEILNPHVPVQDIEHAKNKLSISENDFVIGSFARMEKFQTPFLDVLCKVLHRCKNSKVILAGPNDRARVEKAFEEFIAQKRAIVLPSSDVDILGNCLHLGIDTFPTHSGFSVLELMAKGVPVVAKRDEEMDALWKKRLPELMCDTDDEMVELICQLATNSELSEKFSEKTKNFLKSDKNDELFIHSLDNAISKIKK